MDDEYLGTSETLTWTGKSAITKSKSNRSEDLQFDFNDLLVELRADLHAEREKEDQLLTEMRRELEIAVGTKGVDEFLRSFEQSVAKLCSYVESLRPDVKQLNASLKLVSGLADNISGRVASLDQSKSRVVECLQLVNDLLDLRMCAEGVQSAMRNSNYDEAAQHIHRFLTLDSAVFKVGDQFVSKDTGQSMKQSYEILRKATADLKVIIEKKFDEAYEANDEANMQKYFKIFPMINEYSSGLQRFGKYLVSKVQQFGDEYYKIMLAGGTDDKRRNVLYSDTLTMLLEGIARLIESHHSLIDNFYGPDKLLDLLEILQVEADRQADKILSAFVQKRQLDVKVKQVDKIMRSSSAKTITDKTDARDLDITLSEITVMHTRCELYWRFLKRRLGEAPARPLSESQDEHRTLSPKLSHSVDREDEDAFAFDEMSEEERRAAAEKVKAQRQERNKKLDALLNRSLLSTKTQEILGKYVLMEQYYMTESVTKAIEMEDVEDGSLTSSLLDDVFFIVRKSIRRSITSSSVDCVCAMLNNGCTLLETDYFTHINKVIKTGYPSVGIVAEAFQSAQTAYNVLGHGKSVSEAGPDTQRAAFIIALNNMRMSVENVNKLKIGLKDEFARHLSHLSQRDMGKLDNSIGQLDDLCKKFTHTSRIGLGKLVDAAFKSKLKNNAEDYLTYAHELTDEIFAEYEASDPFVNSFIEQLDKLIANFNHLLVPENYKEFLGVVAAEASKQLENVIFQCYFNRLGALQLDKEFRDFATYLTTVADWSIREKCARLGQLISLMNVETVDEAVDYFYNLQNSNTSSSTLLSITDLKKTLKLRTDLPTDRINAIKM